MLNLNENYREFAREEFLSAEKKLMKHFVNSPSNKSTRKNDRNVCIFTAYINWFLYWAQRLHTQVQKEFRTWQSFICLLINGKYFSIEFPPNENKCLVFSEMSYRLIQLDQKNPDDWMSLFSPSNRSMQHKNTTTSLVNSINCLMIAVSMNVRNLHKYETA
jgi:hypothetical protein